MWKSTRSTTSRFSIILENYFRHKCLIRKTTHSVRLLFTVCVHHIFLQTLQLIRSSWIIIFLVLTNPIIRNILFRKISCTWSIEHWEKKQFDKSLCFQGTILTDGVDTTILKQNVEPGSRQNNDTSTSYTAASSRKRKSRNSEEGVEDVEEFRYVGKLTQEELKKLEGKCVLAGHGRRDILFCMKETSTAVNRQLFRFTKSQMTKKS